jgi:hypothetical protein
MKFIYNCEYCGKQNTTYRRAEASSPRFCSRKCTDTARQSTADDFWLKVEKTEGCWYWKGCKTAKGYGVFTFGGKQYRAHRVAYDLTHKEPLGERLGRHSCDTPSCVRPDHILPGTTYDNVQDKMRRGRFVNVYGKKKMRTGDQNGQAKLTWSQVREIRTKYATGNYSCQMLANEYDITQTPIRNIVKCKSWKSEAIQ